MSVFSLSFKDAVRRASKAWQAERGGSPLSGDMREVINENFSSAMFSVARKRRSTVGNVIGVETLRERQVCGLT